MHIYGAQDYVTMIPIVQTIECASLANANVDQDLSKIMKASVKLSKVSFRHIYYIYRNINFIPTQR